MDINLQRFMEAHQRDYPAAFNEIRAGKKRSHWMWYIFPQVRGLGISAISQHYAINSSEEARAFLLDPYLGKNLIEICEALLALDSGNATEIFGRPDDMKLKSSMTLFDCVAETTDVFARVLDKFFQGKRDDRTLQILGFD